MKSRKRKSLECFLASVLEKVIFCLCKWQQILLSPKDLSGLPYRSLSAEVIDIGDDKEDKKNVVKKDNVTSSQTAEKVVIDADSAAEVKTGEDSVNEKAKDITTIDQEVNNEPADSTYIDAVQWALENRKKNDIRNIAITGSYGSGKSSILKTFLKHNRDKKIKCLNISLASFGEVKEGEDLSRLLELSILQQIIHHEKDSVIPDSKIKKIRHLKTRELFLWVLGIFLCSISLVNLSSHYWLFKQVLKIDISENIETFFHYISILFIVSGACIVLWRIVRIFFSARISKLSFHNTEIELDDKISKSILNHHIDEILYFFEVSGNNVVIIEDIDRFKQTEIFTKLREINLLINNSNKVDDEIVFIYAIKDEMFVNKERTKFFDFIIPVISVINSSNSCGKFLDRLKEYGFETSDKPLVGVSESLVEDISLFIDDMRLLHNIVNEFYIYNKKIGAGKDKNKLLSMVVYKNLCPSDFAELGYNEGILYECIRSKKKYIVKESKRIDGLIDTLKVEIKELEKIKIIDLKELQSLYIDKIFRDMGSYECFSINNTDLRFEDIFEENRFDYFVKNELRYKTSRHSSEQAIPKRFETIEKEVDKEKRYEERKNDVVGWNVGRVNILKQRIDILSNIKNGLRHKILSSLVNGGKLILPLKACSNHQQIDLLRFFLRSGYIDENYSDYISYFHAGSITRTDQQFLLNVKNQNSTEYDYLLNKIEKLVSKIRIPDFKEKYILNYDLVDFIIGKDIYKEHDDFLFELMINESKTVISFIDGYIDNGRKIDLFIGKLTSRWPNFWNYICSQTDYTEEKKDKYLKLIIEYSEIYSIAVLADNSFLREQICKNKEFLNIIQNEEKLQSVIADLDIKFIDLDIEEASKSMLDFVYEGNFYELNITMLEKILQYKGATDKVAFETKNYTLIKNSGCDGLLAYVKDNINIYIREIYLKIETNKREDQSCLAELLNNSDITDVNKKEIIKYVESKISGMYDINDFDLLDFIMESFKVEANWDSIIYYYANNGDKFSDALINFVNCVENAEVLSESKIEKVEDYKQFIQALILEVGISDECYKLVLNSVPYNYKSIDFSTLSKEKVSLLIDKKLLVLTVDNYNMLKNNFDILHIKFVESMIETFIEDPLVFPLDQEDVLHLLESKCLLEQDKNDIINKIEIALVVCNIKSLKIIAELIISENSFKVSKDIIEQILINDSMLEDDNYELLLMSISDMFDSLSFEDLSENKVKSLVYNNVLTFNVTNYELLREKFNGLHIGFLECRKDEYLSSITEYEINEDDLLLILQSEWFSSADKEMIINEVQDDLIIDNPKSLVIASKLIFDNESFCGSYDIVRNLLLTEFISQEEKIRLFNIKHGLFDIEEITEFLCELEQPYPTITDRSKKAKIEDNLENKKLLDVLKSRKYISSFKIEGARIIVSHFRGSKA